MIVSITLLHGAVGVQTSSDAAGPDATRGELFDSGEDVLSVAFQSVELPHGLGVLLAYGVEGGIEMRTAGGRTADAVVGEDEDGTSFAERVALQLWVLLRR